MVNKAGKGVKDLEMLANVPGLLAENSSSAPTERTGLLRSGDALNPSGLERGMNPSSSCFCGCLQRGICGSYFKGWTRAWRKGVKGEYRLIRIFVLIMMWTVAFSMLWIYERSPDQEHGQFILHLTERSLVNSLIWFCISTGLMLFTPGALLPVGLTMLACMMMYRYAFSLFVVSEWELLTEPLAIVSI